ncbi:hypothetical protein BWQ96_07249 [Gracilariopsis chorda]|uniref:Uncharacterized protein n=1 Tax=Gracilariopsis chorda TaxID=448386 RepID=A0A2V3ILN8_9FLOR|nr:hypothetical protein BWQ96_07249 [Gracilariopsis chorda]|eukprot:PXF43001.1 hypothetical protein BWQ96_07249 [Gracilariopsis chorda]
MARPIPQAPLERFLSDTKEEVFRIWREDVTKITKRLEALEPFSRLPTIPSPVRGKDFVREPNVAALMRAAMDFRNAFIPDGEEKYIQFPVTVSDKELNADALDALEMIMIQKIGVDYGKCSWGLAWRRTHVSQCEAVIRTACASKEFLVYKESSYLWCIRWLAEQKMKWGDCQWREESSTFSPHLSTASPRTSPKLSIKRMMTPIASLTRGIKQMTFMGENM